jgi:hypothetical protein
MFHNRNTDGTEVFSLTHPPRKIPGTHFYQRLSQPRDHIATRKTSLEKSNDIRNRARDIPGCTIVPQRTTLPRAHILRGTKMIFALSLFSDILISAKVFYHSINEGQIIGTGSNWYQCWSNEAGICCSARMRRQNLKSIRRKQNVQGKSGGRN